ncbi:helix-turn-helix transcriptional regulator [Romeria aff. gracilis LEGE 07310]|uniref:Helix-turn-helix transcriptional regulator n=1 Tax=Vasconcelosia minhoensis LEGE 07310 TaxID=915328 RepID=A0A8J7AUU7_9CYAN|nr:AraC family transcriptional regulator [Romeria gracilis]MBE9075867.1 helix-turn-helix transcriptional regulator [Romeria aff. gracilis LEGE 07310]
MPPIISQEDFWSLVKHPSNIDLQNIDSQSQQTDLGEFEQIWAYPEQFGRGYYREIQLRPGLDIEISDLEHRTPVVMDCCDRAHPVELHFDIGDDMGGRANTAGQYWLYSSGLAPAKQMLYEPHPRHLSLSLHLEPDVLQTLMGQTATVHLPEIGDLLKAPDQTYLSCCRTTSPVLKVILQQLLQCPYSGPIRRLFLEAKVMELVALTLDADLPQKTVSAHRLRPDDVERIQQAKAILLQDLVNPPSLIGLARQVGLNDCTLKRGFRQVFKTTVFGCLQAQRLEQARLLLLERELNVQQAAHAVGYLSRSHFTAAFRQRFGVNPRELIRDHG